MPLDNYVSIFNQYPPVAAEEWKDRIIKDLKGESFEKLIWHTKEGIDVLPFYTKTDNQKYQLHIPSKEASSWRITERILVEDISTANATALHALQNGTTDLIFDVQHRSFSNDEIETMVKDILLDVAPVYFENYNNNEKSGLEAVVRNSCPAVVKIVPQDTISDELAFALREGLKKHAGIIHFQFQIGQNYFFEMAKLRAFRWLWKQVCELNNQPYILFIQCETSIRDFNKEDANSNILRNTTAAMSAVLGGCDSLIINSHDSMTETSDFGRRIARNIHHILHHESYFNQIEDAVKGSYYIEYLTYQLCKKSWEKLPEFKL